MKRIAALIFALTVFICQAHSQDIVTLSGVVMPITNSVDFSTQKAVGENLMLHLSVDKSEDMKALVFLIYDNVTKKIYVKYVVPKAVALLNNNTTKKDKLTSHSELTLILPKDSQSNAVFFFKQYFQKDSVVAMRVSQFDPLTNCETRVFGVNPSHELFPESPQGDPYYPIIAVLLRAQEEGIIESIQDITDQQ